MRLDAADLALLEIDADKLGPLAREVIVMLIEVIREDEDAVDEVKKALELAEDEADDARIALRELRRYLTDAPLAADVKADEIEACLDRIRPR